MLLSRCGSGALLRQLLFMSLGVCQTRRLRLGLPPSALLNELLSMNPGACLARRLGL